VKARKWMQVAAAAMAFGLFTAGPRSTIMPQAAAQNLGERTVSGTVLSAASTPVEGATVFLKNEKTKTIRSFTSLANGHFHFAQVNKAEDFDLWAEENGNKSAVKTVSSWDARTELVTDLKMK
jgi:hypothetical protein